MGHIMPMRAVCEAFKRKYGDEVDVIETRFFHDSGSRELEAEENDFIKEVKLYSKRLWRGQAEFKALEIFGSRLVLWFLMHVRYRSALKPALKYIQSLKPDVIFNTHLSSLYYSCEARERGMIDAKVIGFCTDPIIGNQWDQRSDVMCVCSSLGAERAIEKKQFDREHLRVIPFLIRDKVKEMTEGRAYYKNLFGIPEDRFTILTADGAYGACKLKDTVKLLLESDSEMAILAVCGKNEELYKEFQSYEVKPNIQFIPFGFTDKMLEMAAAADLFIGKAGASNLAEPTYFGCPSIVTFCALPVEEWICEYYVKEIKSTEEIMDLNVVMERVESYIKDPSLMRPYIEACEKNGMDATGAEQIADILYENLNK